MITSIDVGDKVLWDRFKQIAVGNGKEGASELLREHIKNTVAKFDKPEGITLDKFNDPNYIPTPQITAPLQNQVNFLSKQKRELLREMEEVYHKLEIYCLSFQQMTLEEREENKHNFTYLTEKYTH